MSAGGVLVVLDRLGREVKKYPLPSGIATIGSDLTCNIKIIQNEVSPHHATVIVRNNQTVVRSIGGPTLVNGRTVSVAALQHRDELTVGSRRLRWHYTAPHIVPEPLHLPEMKLATMSVDRRRSRASLRGPTRLADAPLRASLPASLPTATVTSGKKQVAIVQPQRRETTQQNEASPRLTVQPHRPYLPVHHRQRASHSRSADISSTSVGFEDRSKRKSNSRSPKTPEPSLQNTTKATLWIESRKPRKIVRTPTSQLATQRQRQTMSVQKSTPLRMVVLRRTMAPSVPRTPAVGRRVQSEVKTRVTKIQAPLKIDYMKQAAINLMMGHTPKAKLPGKQNVLVTTAALSFPGVTKRKSVKGRSLGNMNMEATPKRASTYSSNFSNRKSKRSQGNQISVIEIEDSNTQNELETNESLNTTASTVTVSSPTVSPKKSALKTPHAKSTRKIESIKFDLSNLVHETDDVVVLSNNTRNQSMRNSTSKSSFTLDNSDTLNTQSPSPRKSINSRSSRMLEKSLGSLVNMSQSAIQNTLTPQSPRGRTSSRGSLIVQKALGTSKRESKRSTRSSYISGTDTITSRNSTRKSNPRNRTLETYSIVDLVSVDSQSTKTYSDSGNSYTVYDSAESSATFGTPLKNVSRATRSSINPASVVSSTPYVGKSRRSQSFQSSPNSSQSGPNSSQSGPRSSQNKSLTNNQTFNVSTRSSASRRSKSLTTPDNEAEFEPVMRVRASRASKSRSRLNDSSLLQSPSATVTEADASPLTSRRTRASHSKDHSTVDTITSSSENSPNQTGIVTPETRQSPQDFGTPKLNIQNLLDSSITSASSKKKNISRRKTFAGARSEPKQRLGGALSKSISVRRTLLRGSPAGAGASAHPPVDESVTPTTSAPLLQEPIRNKHSTAKKNQSKRSLIDNLDESDIVKKLFNSPVKRKLSQSMTEFSKKHLIKNDVPRKRTRHTIAIMSRSPDCTEDISVEAFVSPIDTPNNSPKLTGIKNLLRTPQPRKSLQNNLTNVSRIKLLFATSPRNRISDVRAKKSLYGTAPRDELTDVEGVKPLFESNKNRKSPRPSLTGTKKILRTPRPRKSPRNDLTKVSGIKPLFATSPRNRISDVRGVKSLYSTAPRDDLTNVEGVKPLFESNTKRKSPRNDLTDVRGVKDLFIERKSPRNDLTNILGVKKMLQIRSPRNRLSDVRGVKKLFEKERRDDLNDVSGVKQLLEDSATSSRDADVLSDQTKSHINKSKQHKRKSRDNFSMDNNKLIVEWIHEELKKRTKNPIEQSNTSRMNRELKKLSIDTVVGSPLVHNRTRNTQTSVENLSRVSRRKTPSEVYSARKLPLKKRSLTNASGEAIASASIKLPIKKRVLHSTSTPLKGAAHVTSSADLGRVSPIQPDFSSTQLDNNSTRVTMEQITEIKPRRGRKGKTNTNSVTTTPVKLSPKKTRGGVEKEDSKNKTVTTKKRRSSIVVNKKLVVLNPQSTENSIQNNKKSVTSNLPIKKSPIKRTTRQRVKVTQPASNKKLKAKSKESNELDKDDKLQTSTTATNKAVENKQKKLTKKSLTEVVSLASPKKTRGKANKGSLIITKLSPKMTPQAPKTRGKKLDIINSTTESKIKNQPSPKKTRGKVSQKGNLVIAKTPPKTKPQAKLTRGKNKTEITPETVVILKKVTRGKNEPEITPETVVIPKKVTRGKNKPETTPETVVIPKKATRGKNKPETSPETVVIPKKVTRGKNKPETIPETVVMPKKATRGKNKPEIEPQNIVVPKKATRARNQTEQETESDAKKKATKTSTIIESKVTTRTTRTKVAIISQTDSITKTDKRSTSRNVANETKTDVTKKVEKVTTKNTNKHENESETTNKNVANKTETKAKTENASKNLEHKPATRRRKVEELVEIKPECPVKSKILKRNEVKDGPVEIVSGKGGRNVAKKSSVLLAPATRGRGRKRNEPETSEPAEAAAASGRSKRLKRSPPSPPPSAGPRSRRPQLANEGAATSRPRRR